jgi:hypothetical protein
MLLTLPEWIEGITGLSLEGRIGLALQALRLTGLLLPSAGSAAGTSAGSAAGSAGGSSAPAGGPAPLQPAATAREWVSRPLSGRCSFVRDALAAVDGGTARLFSLMDEETVPADGARGSTAPWVVLAFSSVPQSTFIRFADFAEYQAAIGSPLEVTAVPAVTDGSRLPTEEAAEELWKSFLGIFLGRCLLSLGGAEAGVSADGKPVFRMTGDGRLLLGAPREGLEEPPGDDQRPAALIVSPNYEVVFLSPSPGLEAELGRFCDRVGREVGVLFRISRQSVRRAAAAGLLVQDVLGALSRGSRSPLPSNVEHEIRSWMGGTDTA